MSEQQSSNRATILFDSLRGLDFVELINELQRPFRNIALEFDETAVAEDSHAMFISESMVLRVGYAPQTDWTKKLSGAQRPAQARHSRAIVNALLEDVSSALVIEVSNGPGRDLPERTRLAACFHVVRHLARRYEASLIHWDLNNTLFTDEEFENPNAMAQTARPFHPTRVKAKRQTTRPKMDLTGAASFAGDELEATHRRLDESFAKAVHQRDADAPEKVRKTLDDTRADERLRRERNRIFADDLIESTDSRRPPPPEEIGLLEQLAVYIMTVTIMVLSFPVGFAMLIYTVLKGESLNATGRVMALTGVGVGFASSPLPQALAAFV
ncbi:hypothetical protein ATO10_01890 [Actibacterium atlanticum]|uniref:Uncharacterized protein n=1 Tax=Actibacterium atlanticum TaxID=1461693 RepID=A0A058ZQM2_9RHOB|nr:hypothetical protein [Actibacterium atlanticum]KCV83472.1 hypothetical protein ATO10_01890 [Actibacterium atlanticum]